MVTSATLSPVLTRLIAAAGSLFAISLVVFFLLHVIPGDPVEAMLGEQAGTADREVLRRALGLDVPWPTQLLDYYRDLAHFDLGVSLYSQEPIASLLIDRLPYTVGLALMAMLFALVIAVPLGALSALYRGSLFARGVTVFAMVGTAIPNFVLGPIFIVIFAVILGWAPIGGAEVWNGVVLPALSLSIGLSAVISQQLSAALTMIYREDYVRAAYARGLDRLQVLLRHALRNAALPVTTTLGLQLGALFGGAVITETVFAWPGLGALTVEAIERRDYPVVQGCVLCISVSYVLINMLTDGVYAWCDPRIRKMSR
ncbi:MAG: ABC transporter permease [Gammaproteobacteria bacterium]|nr:ABC transporter permease [Gammaproteobacteria bacterium]